LIHIKTYILIYFQVQNYRFYYQKSNVVKAPIINGQVSTYGGGGYVKSLAINSADTGGIIDSLKLLGWIDRGTRAVFLDFTVYNANINLFCQIRLVKYD